MNECLSVMLEGEKKIGVQVGIGLPRGVGGHCLSLHIDSIVEVYSLSLV